MLIDMIQNKMHKDEGLYKFIYFKIYPIGKYHQGAGTISSFRRSIKEPNQDPSNAASKPFPSPLGNSFNLGFSKVGFGEHIRDQTRFVNPTAINILKTKFASSIKERFDLQFLFAEVEDACGFLVLNAPIFE